MSRAMASCAAADGGTSSYVPRSATPTEPGVEPLRMRAHDVAVDAAEPALVDRPEAVDEKVVADVVPAVPLHVEELDPLHDRGRFRSRVAVATRGVVDDREADTCRVARRATTNPLVRTPRRARHDRRRHGRGRRSQRDERLRAPHQVRLDPRHVSDRTCLDAIRLADPPRVAETPSFRPLLPRPRIRAVLRLGSTHPPRAPLPVLRVGTEEDLSGAPPVHPGEREPRDGFSRASNARSPTRSSSTVVTRAPVAACTEGTAPSAARATVMRSRRRRTGLPG